MSGGQGMGLDGDDAWAGTLFQSVRSGRTSAGIDTAFACGPFGERSLPEEGALPRFLFGVEVRLLGRDAFPKRPLRKNRRMRRRFISIRTFRRKVPA